MHGVEWCAVPSQRAYRCLALPRHFPITTPFERRALTLRSRKGCGTSSAPIPTTGQMKKGPSTHCGLETAAKSTSTEPAGFDNTWQPIDFKVDKRTELASFLW